MPYGLIALLAIHIAGIIIWSGSLLYLPALLASGASGDPESAFERGPVALNRLLFTCIATPAALFAIITGSILFLLDRNLDAWLVFKLTAVTGMVCCHAMYGLLILRQERDPKAPDTSVCIGLGALTTVLIALILWLVLGKPF